MKMIKTTTKADAILAIIEDILPEEEDTKIYLTPYQNGREHGWSLNAIKPDKQIVFSENRNSDHIIIYFGKSTEFDPAGNMPSDKAWDNRTTMPHNEYYQAAEFIVKFLKGDYE